MRIAPKTIAPGSDKGLQELKKATQQFESYFLDTLLKEMRKSVPKDTLLGDDSHGQEIFRDLSDEKLSEAMSQRGDLGLGDMLYRQLAPAIARTEAAAAGKDGDSAGKDQAAPKAAPAGRR